MNLEKVLNTCTSLTVLVLFASTLCVPVFAAEEAATADKVIEEAGILKE